MKRFWLFRSNIKELEYYHEYKNLSPFINKCHDYYMLLPLWLLHTKHFDEVTIWRLTNKHRDPIVFSVNGKTYIQRWVRNFKDVFKFPKPEVSFFRGGFKEYDDLTKIKPDFLGTKIYLGAGQRINAQWGGKYDLFLMEDDKDLKANPKTLPFYKTASPYIFYPDKKISECSWDICWPCNFTQIKYKGQEQFIKTISNSKFLKSLKIVHCGNMPNRGQKLCKKYGVKNIEFLGWTDRVKLNEVLNKSKFGLNLSNRLDGCPRVSTEILMSGTPLIIHERTRLLSYYKNRGVIQVNDNNIPKKIKVGLNNYQKHKDDVIKAIRNELSFDNINQKNIEEWQKI